MIREVHKVISDWNDWDDKYIVYYLSGKKNEYFGYNIPKSVKNFINNEETEVMFVTPGNYHRYFTR